MDAEAGDLLLEVDQPGVAVGALLGGIPVELEAQRLVVADRAFGAGDARWIRD